MSEMSLRERVARKAYPLIISGTDYDAVPIDEAFSRARYTMLAQQAFAVADAAIALVVEEAARVARAHRDTQVAVQWDWTIKVGDVVADDILALKEDKP